MYGLFTIPKTMSSSSPSAIEIFQQTFAQSPAFRASIRSVGSVPELIALLQSRQIHLTGEELQSLAQRAFETWVATLSPVPQAFFVQARQDPTLNKAIETCRTLQDVITLAATF